ncbi:MAG: tRNA pseudouridine(38-40) synthase TruA [Candidatus Omnitrophica bacterium]|nr:tRNA pseudouridine(38-40) synthase TruA [Candidatus Omnitrophota bacterium]
MRTLKLTLAYDGTDYAGWQVQRGSKPTIQGTLQQALRRILKEPVRVVGSGRTDAGVHARGQVAHIRTRSRIPCDALRRALNSRLPPDTAVLKVQEAPAGFHARFSAKRKRYHYHLFIGDVVLPFHRRYVHHVRAPLNLALMRREARVLQGRHDVSAFQRSGRPVRDARRTIYAARVLRKQDWVTIEIEASGFLYAMMRRIVGTLIDIGRGYRPPGTMQRLLKSRNLREAGPTAPPHALFLVRVVY